MRRPFSLVLLHGDGTRVLRVCLPRWIVHGALAVMTLAATAVLDLTGEYLLRRHQSMQLAALRQRADEARVLAPFQARLAAVRREIVAWKALHAKMWTAFAPEAAVPGGDPDPGVPSAEASEPTQTGELDLLASNVAEEGPRVRQLEQLATHVSEMMGALPLGWPVHGHVSSEYGVRRSPWGRARERHEGIDIGSLPGTPVEAPAAGTVVAVSSHGGYGRHVVLDHGNGVRSRYAHMRKLDVQVGQRVEKGQVIGFVGSTGRSTGPHLHYEVLVDGKRVNPRSFLQQESPDATLAHAAPCSTTTLALGPCANRPQ